MIMIVTGDCRVLAKQIRDQSVDLFFTDPPYLSEYLYLYDWLAEESNRLLKPSGFVGMCVGSYHLIDVVKIIGDRLDYFMELIIYGSGYGSMMWQRRIIGKHKSILLFRPKGGIGLPRCNMTSIFTGTGADKRYHIWGQDETSARYYIEFLHVGGILSRELHGVCIQCGMEFHWSVSDRDMERLIRRLMESRGKNEA